MSLAAHSLVQSSKPAVAQAAPNVFLNAKTRSLMLRFSLAIVFVWFGGLKVVGLSPATDLVARTFSLFPAAYFVPFLGVCEVLIGAGLLWKRTLPLAFACFLVQMVGTLFPLFVLPDVCFTHFPWELTLEGQYIVKNVVLVSAAFAAVMPCKDE